MQAQGATAREAECSHHRYGRRQVMIAIVTVVGAAPSMAEGTTSVEPAGGAEKAPTEALEPGAYGRAGNRWGLLMWRAGEDVKGGWVTASTWASRARASAIWPMYPPPPEDCAEELWQDL